jgi:cytochrome b pre-mRNA-processing protein 3
MFKDIDLTLREMGAGDLGVGKRIKVMSESFMGRLSKYSLSVENKDATLLADTLSRNLYRKDAKVNEDSKITLFVLNFHEQISSLNAEYLISGDFNMNEFIANCLSNKS